MDCLHVSLSWTPVSKVKLYIPFITRNLMKLYLPKLTFTIASVNFHSLHSNIIIRQVTRALMSHQDNTIGRCSL